MLYLKGEITMADMRIIRKCKTCQKPFSISQKEAVWLKEKGLELFAHCAECRAKKKESKVANTVEPAIIVTPGKPYPGMWEDQI